MGRRKKEAVSAIPKKKCLHCGIDLEYKQFHKSGSGIYMGNGNLVPVCKGCFKILYEQYRIQYMDQLRYKYASFSFAYVIGEFFLSPITYIYSWIFLSFP